jgi:hypothetical protein
MALIKNRLGSVHRFENGEIRKEEKSARLRCKWTKNPTIHEVSGTFLKMRKYKVTPSNWVNGFRPLNW